MSDGWISDDRNLTQNCPVYCQTSGHGDSCRDAGTGRAHGNWLCGGRSDNNKNDKFGAPENEQVIEGGRFGHNGNFRENSSGGGNVDVVGTRSKSRFTVKSADVGKIIGKGGCKIRDFEEESGAHIQVCDY